MYNNRPFYICTSQLKTLINLLIDMLILKYNLIMLKPNSWLLSGRTTISASSILVHSTTATTYTNVRCCWYFKYPACCVQIIYGCIWLSGWVKHKRDCKQALWDDKLPCNWQMGANDIEAGRQVAIENWLKSISYVAALIDRGDSWTVGQLVSWPGAGGRGQGGGKEWRQ